MADIWERWDGETSKAFSAFRFYRDTPAKDRSIHKCVFKYYGAAKDSDPPSPQMGKVKTWEEWASRWQWTNRVRQWEDYQDQVGREAELTEIKEMKRRHSRIAMSIQAKAAERLQNLNPGELTARDVLAMFIEAARLERTSRGEPDIIEEKHIEYESIMRKTYTLDQLREMSELVGLDQVVETVGGIPFDEDDSEQFLPDPHT